MDEETGDWKCYEVERGTAMINGGTGDDDDRRTDNAATCAIPHVDSDVVSAVSQPMLVSSATYADAQTQTPSSSDSTDAGVSAEAACDDKDNATAGWGTSLGDSVGRSWYVCQRVLIDAREMLM